MRRVRWIAAAGMLVAMLGCGGGTGSAEPQPWVLTAGGEGPDRATAIAAYDDGSVVVVGSFSGVAEFGTGDAGATILDAADSPWPDAFVARYRADGALAWARRAGGVGHEDALAVVALPDGSCVVTGRFSGTATFGPGEPGETVLDAVGGWDVFLAKFERDGDLGWATAAGGSLDDTGSSVTRLSGGDLILAAACEGAATFGLGEANQTDLPDDFDNEACTARYAPDGTLRWARRLTPGAPTPGEFDAHGALVAARPDGSYLELCREAPGFLKARSGVDDSTLWRRNLWRNGGTVTGGGRGYVNFEGLCVLPDGSHVAVGNSSAGIVVENSNGSTTFTLIERDIPNQAFVLWFDPVGDYAGVAAAAGSASALGVTGLEDGSVVVVGVFDGEVTLRGLGGGASVVSAGSSDGFVARYGPDRSLSWFRRIGGPGVDQGWGAAAAPDGGAVVVGSFRETTTIAPYDGADVLRTSGGDDDLFGVRYAADGSIPQR